MVSNTDSGCGATSSNPSRFTCALSAIQTMLGDMQPCAAGGTSCTPSNSLFRVALFAFPNVTVSTRPEDYGCSGTIPTPEQYTLPKTGLSGYTALTYSGTQSTYAVTLPNTGNADANGFLSDYFSLTTSNSLNASSEIVKAVGGASGCTAMNTQGGESTYYGGVIYAAQNALTAEQALYPNSSNAMILLSDGEATAANTKFPSSNTTPSPSADGYAIVTNSTSNTSTNLSNGSFGYYPDFHDECQQAIVAAQAATTAGTRVYAWAYGSESSGCTTSSSGTDSTLVATGNNVPFTMSGSNAISPCITMENIASSMKYFYSDAQSGTINCAAAGNTTVNLQDSAGAIAASMTKPRLLPNSSFSYAVVQTS
jgi:hypothetical protein